MIYFIYNEFSVTDGLADYTAWEQKAIIADRLGNSNTFFGVAYFS